MLIPCELCMSRIWWQQCTRGQTTCVLLLMCYTVSNVMHAYIAHLPLVSISQNFASDSYAIIKFKLSCTVASYNVSSVQYFCVQPWLYFDNKPCCCQCVCVFTSWYDSPYLTSPFLHPRCFYMRLSSLLTFVRLMHCNRSRMFYSHTYIQLPLQKLIRRYISQYILFH